MKPLIIAHRGESAEAPENTLAAINLAWQNGTDGIEIDIQLTKDNKIVVFHDKNTRRTCGVNGPVRFLKLDELKNLNAGFHKGLRWQEQIPTLREVLQTVPKKKSIFIELKSGRKIIPALKEILQNTSLEFEQIKIIGFNLKTMSEAKKELPKFEVFWTRRIGQEKIFFNKKGWNKIIEKAKQNNFEGLTFSYSKKLRVEIVKSIKAENLKIFVWTVNNLKKAVRLADLNIDGIMTDKAGWLKEELNAAEITT